MYANSRSIASGQTGIHEPLAARVARHCASQFRKPITDYNRHAFDDSIAAWQRQGGAPLILDAGCGVGLSSRHLATRFPTHFIIGVDQSADRLARDVHWPQPVPPNMLLVRADLVDYWRLLQAQRIVLARQYLLYPNPWPKIGHLGRRWHGHPVFPTVVALGGAFECRSNWRIYVDECAAVLTQLTGHVVATEALIADEPITPFEKKYRDSGQTLWRCATDLPRP
jgi:tRNA (guanine-N7-)-methyltransferase